MMKRVAQKMATVQRRRLSQSSASNSADTSSFARCETLSAALPRLREVFSKKANQDTNIFPLFNEKAEKMIWRTVKVDPSRHAAVLVPLVSLEGVPSLLFTIRSSHLSSHASEVSFPGGHFDDETADDESLEDTAIREAQEELLGDNVPWDQIEILGRATAVPSIKGTPVTPIIAVLPFVISADTFPGHAGEVEETFCVSLDDLMAMETSETSERFKGNIPVFPAGDNKKIWGLTAVITRPVLHKLFKPVFLNKSGKSRL